MKLKQRPEDFEVRESWRFDKDPRGAWRVYLMDKQKLSTFEAVQRISDRFRVPVAAISFCGLKDKQGRTEQLVAVRGRDEAELQDPDLRLKYLGRTAKALSAVNLTSNRFAVTVRDLGEEDVARVASAVAEVNRIGVVNYFDSQRFGGIKHGQGFIAKDLVKGQVEHALYNYLAKPSPLDRTDDAKVKRFWSEHWGEWDLRCPYKAVVKYRTILSHLRSHPDDFAGAFLEIEPRYRALLVFEYQSYLWNEGVKQLLLEQLDPRDHVSIRYQAGRLILPRSLPGKLAREMRQMTFPLLAADSTFDDERVERAVMQVLGRERIELSQLDLSRLLPGVFFKHEERPIFIQPGKLVVTEGRPDELNRGRLKVNVAFTLPPGAYATLVVKRLFWFAMLEEEAEAQGELHPLAARALESAFGTTPEIAKPPEPKPSTPKLGFREKQQLRKVKKAVQNAAAAEKQAAKDAKKAKAAEKKPKRPRRKPDARKAARKEVRKAIRKRG